MFYLFRTLYIPFLPVSQLLNNSDREKNRIILPAASTLLMITLSDNSSYSTVNCLSRIHLHYIKYEPRKMLINLYVIPYIKLKNVEQICNYKLQWLFYMYQNLSQNLIIIYDNMKKNEQPVSNLYLLYQFYQKE